MRHHRSRAANMSRIRTDPAWALYVSDPPRPPPPPPPGGGLQIIPLTIFLLLQALLVELKLFRGQFQAPKLRRVRCCRQGRSGWNAECGNGGANSAHTARRFRSYIPWHMESCKRRCSCGHLLVNAVLSSTAAGHLPHGGAPPETGHLDKSRGGRPAAGHSSR